MWSRVVAFYRAKQRRLVHGLLIALIAILASAAISASEFGRVIDEKTLDHILRWQYDAAQQAEPHKQIVLIDITEKDFADPCLFARKRPLDPKIILRLINAAANGGATLVAVDIDTEDWSQWPPNAAATPDTAATPDSCRRTEVGTLPDKPLEWARGLTLPNKPLVWARGFHTAEDPLDEPGAVVPEPLLGEESPDLERICAGYPFLGAQAGIVRWFYKAKTIRGKLEPSFVSQIKYRNQNSSCQTNVSEADPDRRLIINFAYRLQRVAASAVFEASEKPGWKDRREFDGAMVILGGSFHQGGDMLATPVGPLPGLVINGLALATLIDGREVTELSEVQIFLVDAAFAIGLVLCGIFSHRLAVWATGGAFSLSILLGQYLYQHALFLSSLPILLGLCVHLWLERPRHDGPLHRRAARR
jgi:CHASE2 domain-containing sensor protein